MFYYEMFSQPHIGLTPHQLSITGLLNDRLAVIRNIMQKKQTYISQKKNAGFKSFKTSQHSLFSRYHDALCVYEKRFNTTTQTLVTSHIGFGNLHSRISHVYQALPASSDINDHYVSVLWSLINQGILSARTNHANPTYEQVCESFIENMPSRVYSDVELNIIANLYSYASIRQTFEIRDRINRHKDPMIMNVSPLDLQAFLANNPHVTTLQRYFIPHFISRNHLTASYSQVRDLIMFGFNVNWLSEEDTTEFSRQLFKSITPQLLDDVDLCISIMIDLQKK